MACLGQCAYSILALAHARLAASGQWVLNEKGLMGQAGLEGLAGGIVGMEDHVPGLIQGIQGLVEAER